MGAETVDPRRRALRRAVRFAAVLAALPIVLVLQAGPGNGKFDPESDRAVREAVRVELQEAAAPAPLAGMSAIRLFALRPLDERKLGRQAATPEYHQFRHRCAACHELPDPALHGPAEWGRVVERMRANMNAAGILPLQDPERDAILRFLRRNVGQARE